MYDLSSTLKNWAEAICLIAVEEKKEEEYINYSEEILKVFRTYGSDLDKILKKRDSHINQDSIDFIDKTFGCFIKEEKLLNAIKLIIDNNLIHFIKVIFKTVIRDLLLNQNKVMGYVYSTIELSKSEITQIENKISKKIGLEVSLLNKIDESLIGGVSVKVQDYYFDGSIKGLVHDIKKTVKNSKNRK